MLWLFIGLLGGFAFVYLTRLFWADALNPGGQDPAGNNRESDGSSRRRPLVTAAIVVLVLALVMLVTTGRVHWLSAAVTGAIPFLRRVTSLLRYAPSLQNGLWNGLKKARDGLAGRASSAQGSANRGTAATPDITISQARQILDVKDNASVEEIVAAHRRLIARNHPDKGGSTYIAAQLNTAKDLLLDTQTS